MDYIWIAEIRYSIENDYRWTFIFAAESLEAAKADIVALDEFGTVKYSKFWTDKSGYTYTRKRFSEWNGEKDVYETIRIHRVSLVKEKSQERKVS